MVDPELQQHVATDSTAHLCRHNSPEKAPRSSTETTDSAFTPRSSRPVSRSISAHASRNSINLPPSQPSTQESNVSAHAMSQPASPTRAVDHTRFAQYQHYYTSQHSRGFDQSGFPLTSAPRGLATSSPSSPRLLPTYRSTRSLGGSEGTSPSRIRIPDQSAAVFLPTHPATPSICRPHSHQRRSPMSRPMR